MSLPVVPDAARGRILLAGEPHVFHCHHYNVYLQRVISDASEFVSARPFLLGAAVGVAHAQLSRLFSEGKIDDIAQRKALAAEVYRWAGFGTIDFGPLEKTGGATRTPHSHYAAGWRSRFGPAQTPVCTFSSGWIAGALSAIYGLPADAFQTEHPECGACGPVPGPCVFTLRPGRANYKLQKSPGAGPINDVTLRPEPPTKLDREGITQALSGLPLVGDDQGDINAFGVHLTRHYANYYNRIGFELLRAAVSHFTYEGRMAVGSMLEQAGHVCAFHTFGGIMSSTEWDALVRPNCETKEDWIHGVVAVINCLGWGRWQVTKLSRHEAEFVIHNDYESVGYVAMYGRAPFPVTFMAQGVATGLMDLVYAGNIEAKPALTLELYNDLFRDRRPYQGSTEACRATGDDFTIIRVNER